MRIPISAEYEKQIVPAIPAQLKTKHGRSFIGKNLRRMLRYAENFSAKHMVMAFSQKLSWSHFISFP